MPINSLYNQYDANREAGQGMQSAFRKLSLFSYDALKFLINFIGSMIKMAMGK